MSSRGQRQSECDDYLKYFYCHTFQVQVPPHIENLIFPETISSKNADEWATEKTAQCYSLVLTDERGERSYG